MMKLKVGQLIKCKVTGCKEYGVFVVYKEYSGLIHISEISDQFIKNINDYAMEGDYIYTKILAIDEENKKLKLTIKGIDEETKEMITHRLESGKGFEPLREQLPLWTEEKIKEYGIKRSE